MSERPRRLVFGEIAELYEARRPTYPQALVDDLVAWASHGVDRPAALEIGAGTGKATRLMAARGVAVTAIEPSAEMAAVARRLARETDGAVDPIESDFEHADLGGRRFPLVYAGQAWHWVTVPRGFELARAALVGGGRLVPFWNRPAWGRSELRAALDDVYAAHLPSGLGRGPYHPSVTEASSEYGQWPQQIAEVDGLGDPEVREYEWSIDYTASQYAGLVATHSETRLLDHGTRERFLTALERTVEDHGGSFRLQMRTFACVAVARD
ncbi:MAG TPA: class I SAM-dependent methyltransferase [Solirubrobacteraceae bacterium]|nr:class I SAM-dependent methyltransferase [Solirubrobacteraceae bacterium]